MCNKISIAHYKAVWLRMCNIIHYEWHLLFIDIVSRTGAASWRRLLPVGFLTLRCLRAVHAETCWQWCIGCVCLMNLAELKISSLTFRWSVCRPTGYAKTGSLFRNDINQTDWENVAWLIRLVVSCTFAIKVSVIIRSWRIQRQKWLFCLSFNMTIRPLYIAEVRIPSAYVCPQLNTNK